MVSESKLDIWNAALNRIGETKRIEDENATTVTGGVCRTHYTRIVRKVLEMYDWPWATAEAVLSEIGEQTTTFDYPLDATHKLIDVPFAFTSSSQLTVELGVDGAYEELDVGTDYTATPYVPATATLGRITLTDALASGESIRVTVTTERVGWENIYALPADCVRPIGLLYAGRRFYDLSVGERQPHSIQVDNARAGKILCCNLESVDFDALEYIADVQHVPLFSGHFEDAVVWFLAAELALALKKSVNTGGEFQKAAKEAVDEAAVFEQNVGYQGPGPLTGSEMAR